MNKQFWIMALLSLWMIGVRAEDLSGPTQTGTVDGIAQAISELGNILVQKNVAMDGETLQTAIVNAMIAAIDPHAAILTREQMERRQEEERGVFSGVGLKIRIAENWPVIAEVMKDGPAVDSGLMAGDTIEKIGEESTENMALAEVVKLLRGRKGEVAELEVLGKDKTSERRSIKVTRGVVQMPVTGTMEEWPQQIGYVKVNGLYEGSGEQIASQLKIWAEAKYFGIILDIRDANGMDIISVVRIASLFAEAGDSLFSIRDDYNTVLANYQADEGKRITTPLMALTDRGTFGAAEALAAVLRHCTGVLLIGTATSGDNRIREAIPLADGRILCIATKHIDLGKRSTYCGEGVIPHVVVSESDMVQTIEPVQRTDDYGIFSGVSADEQDSRALIVRVSNDAVLRRATDILLGIKALNIQIP